MKKVLIICVFIKFSLSCSSPQFYLPQNINSEIPMLSDCTDSVSSYMDWEQPKIPEEDKKSAIKAASAWAVDACYLPCNYKMCATITEYDGSSVSVYISYEFKEDEITIGPEAQVEFDMVSFKVKSKEMWHSGCRWNAKDCKLFSGE